MGKKLPFRTFQPAFFSGLLDDPIMVVKIRQQNRSFLVDCGQLTHIAKRVINSIDTIFTSHAHMDHIIGFDTFTRNVLVSNRIIKIYGPPKIAEKLAFRLKGYDWNLVEDYFCRFQMIEVHPDKLVQFKMNGASHFELEKIAEKPKADNRIYDDSFFRVDAELCDHKIPVLVYRFTEKPEFQIDEKKMLDQGYKPGRWILELKNWFYGRDKPGTINSIIDQNIEQGAEVDCRTLYKKICSDDRNLSIGYVTDVGYNAENRRKILELLKGIKLLVCECTFLRKDKSKARESFHLCTEDLNEIISALKPQFVVPLHLSKTYLGQSNQLFEELVLPSNTSVLRLSERVTEHPMIFSDGLELARHKTPCSKRSD